MSPGFSLVSSQSERVRLFVVEMQNTEEMGGGVSRHDMDQRMCKHTESQIKAALFDISQQCVPLFGLKHPSS